MALWLLGSSLPQGWGLHGWANPMEGRCPLWDLQRQGPHGWSYELQGHTGEFTCGQGSLPPAYDGTISTARLPHATWWSARQRGWYGFSWYQGLLPDCEDPRWLGCFVLPWHQVGLLPIGSATGDRFNQYLPRAFAASEDFGHAKGRRLLAMQGDQWALCVEPNWMPPFALQSRCPISSSHLVSCPWRPLLGCYVQRNSPWWRICRSAFQCCHEQSSWPFAARAWGHWSLCRLCMERWQILPSWSWRCRQCQDAQCHLGWRCCCHDPSWLGQPTTRGPASDHCCLYRQTCLSRASSQLWQGQNRDHAPPSRTWFETTSSKPFQLSWPYTPSRHWHYGFSRGQISLQV